MQKFCRPEVEVTGNPGEDPEKRFKATMVKVPGLEATASTGEGAIGALMRKAVACGFEPGKYKIVLPPSLRFERG